MGSAGYFGCMKNVLVTGAAGFLGSHLCRHHLEAGDRVLGVDNFCSSDQDSEHLKRLLTFKDFTLVEEDVCTDFRGWLDLTKPIDLIYNMACPASPPTYQSMPVLTMLTCTVGVANVLDLAGLHKAVVVHASTSEVYGEPLRSPQDEKLRSHVNSYGPRACYDAGKMAAEALCFDYFHTYETDVRLARIHNTYGPHMDPFDGRVVSNFIRQVLAGEKLTVYGDGSQTRSFCYVDDLVRGLVALGALSDNPRTPINLGNPNEFSVTKLATEVIHQVLGGREAPWRDVYRWLDYRQLPVDDPTRRCPDIALARQFLQWEPTVQLNEGVTKTIEYFRTLGATQASQRVTG